MILCCRILIVSIITALMYFIIMIHVSSLDKLNNRLGNLENDIQYIMESFSKHQRKNDDVGSNKVLNNDDENSDSEQSQISYDSGSDSDQRSLSDDETYNDLKSLQNEVFEMKQTLDRLVETLNKTGLNISSQSPPINLAAEALGTKILYVVDEQLVSLMDSILSIFGIQKLTNTPRNILAPSVEPGNCYGFKGTKSKIMIKLPRRTVIESFSIEHIPQYMSPWGNVTNAPKDFTVHASNCSDNEDLIFLGEFQYQISTQQTLQFFSIKEQDNSFQCVQFDFLTNHGDNSHTCIYRVGVHGRFVR